MHILIAHESPIPVTAYGGTERVIWDLARGLVACGHRVTFLVPDGSTCPFAAVQPIRPGVPWREQVGSDIDIAHFQFKPDEDLDVPLIVTEHGNCQPPSPFPLNTVFVSADHARRHGAECFVHNGLDWSSYAPVDWDRPRGGYHFLGKGEWRLKNLRGAIRVAERAGERIEVLGGVRFNIRRGLRFTLYPRARFHGMVGGQRKFDVLNGSRGLIFPVRWNEPFGMAVIESLYFGCPVFATPYGALPEIVEAEHGVLSADARVLAEAVRANRFDPRACHARAVDVFNAERMTDSYLALYDRVLSGETLNPRPPQLTDLDRNLPWVS